MIAKCTLPECPKIFVEEPKLGGVDVSEEKQLEKLGTRFVKHLQKKHTEELKAIQESVANYSALLVMMVFSCEDTYYNAKLEELREAAAEDAEADIDNEREGAVAACYHLAELRHDVADGLDREGTLSRAIDEYRCKLQAKYSIEDGEIADYMDNLKDEELEPDGATEAPKDVAV